MLSRIVKPVNLDTFNTDLLQQLTNSIAANCVNEATNIYQDALQQTSDQHAPNQRQKTHTNFRLNFSKDMQLLKREVRKQERIHVKSKVTVTRQILDKVRPRLANLVNVHQSKQLTQKIAKF